MSKLNRFLLLLFLVIVSTTAYNVTSCISGTSCRCSLTQYSMTLASCSRSLSDLPIFDSSSTNNITRIIARNALTNWPRRLCQYANLQILDLSGSSFDSQSADLSCLTHLIHLNLSNTRLTEIPRLPHRYLQILDLSNNHIRLVDGSNFRSFDSLLSLLLQNNPIERIDHLADLLQLTDIQSINLLSSASDVSLKESLTVPQWTQLATQWQNSTKSFVLRIGNVSLQSIIPYPDQLQTIPLEFITPILRMLLNSTFITRSNTPQCTCSGLRQYQRVFAYVDYPKKYISPLFLFTQCLMADGITHARLFDRLTYVGLRCPLLGKISFFPILPSSSPPFTPTYILFCILGLIYLY